MLAFSACIAGSFSLGALAAPHLAPAALNAPRFWIAVAIVGAIVLARGQEGALRLSGFGRYAVLGGLYAVYFILMFVGLQTAPAISMSAVFTLTPLIAALAGWVILRQRVTPRVVTALLIGGAGALWVIFDADWHALRQIRVGRGEAIFLVGCAAHAVYAPMVRRLNRGEPALVLALGVLIATATIITAFGLPAILATDWAGLPAIVWTTILYTSVFATAASVVLMQVASLRLPAAKVLAHTYLVPGWVIVWELAFGRPAPPVQILAGLGLSVVALIVLVRDEDAPPRPPRG